VLGLGEAARARLGSVLKPKITPFEATARFTSIR
jgi:hypothetical protein